MSYPRKLPRFVFTLSTVAWLSVVGCVPHVQYRTSLVPCAPDPTNRNCRTAAIEEPSSKRYLLCFVEFDDQGWLWDRNQLLAMLKKIQEEEDHQRLVIIVYVHGWQHNASYDDENVRMIRRDLQVLQRLEVLTSRREGRP